MTSLDVTINKRSMVYFSNVRVAIDGDFGTSKPQVVNWIRGFMDNSVRAHWEAVNWIQRYSKGTIDTVFFYGGTSRVDGFID